MTKAKWLLVLLASTTQSQAQSLSPSQSQSLPPPAAWNGCDPHDPTPWPFRTEAEGLWGETPAFVPSSEYRQERRAPKMPDADKYLPQLGKRHVNALTHALLVCDVETYSRDGHVPSYRYKLDQPRTKRQTCSGDWDLFGAPDTLLRFQFRVDYPITLFGPEDHWGFFVSIPDIAIAVGDRLAIKLWDRDSGTSMTGNFNQKKDDYMGEVSTTFDGNLPIVVRAPFFMLRCNATQTPMTWAKRWLALLDQNLNKAEHWQPDRNQWGFGSNTALDAASDSYGAGNVRYPAGFLGWADPEIQRRLARTVTISAAIAGKKRALFEELIKSAPALTATTRLNVTRGTLRLTKVECVNNCIIELEVDRTIAKAMCEHNAGAQLSGIDSTGTFGASKIELHKGDEWIDCKYAALTGKGPFVLRHTLPAPRLLWFKGGKTAQIFSPPI